LKGSLGEHLEGLDAIDKFFKSDHFLVDKREQKG